MRYVVSSGRRQPLSAFSTPGFQAQKSAHQTLPVPKRDVIYISSDSAPSTPGPVKRHSSGFSVCDDFSSHPPKRPKRTALEEKENILGPSLRVNGKSDRPSFETPHSDLSSVRCSVCHSQC